MNPIQDMLKMKGDLLAYHTLMKGEFDKEIARIEGLGKAIEVKLGLVKTLEDAQAKAALIISTAEGLAKSAVAKSVKAEAAAKAAAEAQAAADIKSNIARELELEVKKGWDELDRAKAAHAAYIATTTANFAQAQADLNKSASAVVKQQEAVTAKAAQIAAALKSL
jgi:hypothetical protein